MLTKSTYYSNVLKYDLDVLLTLENKDENRVSSLNKDHTHMHTRVIIASQMAAHRPQEIDRFSGDTRFTT